MQKKVDEKFQALKDKYYTIEMNVSDDRKMLNQEKAKLHIQEENQVLAKHGIVYSALFATLCGLLALTPLGVIAQIVVGALSLTGALGAVVCAHQSFKYKNKIADTKNTIKIVEDRLKGYEEDKKSFARDSREYFKGTQLAPQSTAKEMPSYQAPKSDAKQMPAYTIKDDGMSL